MANNIGVRESSNTTAGWRSAEESRFQVGPGTSSNKIALIIPAGLSAQIAKDERQIEKQIPLFSWLASMFYYPE